MPLSNSLRRLLRIRVLQEEQERLALEAALSEADRVRSALEFCAQRGKDGRLVLTSGAQSGELTDRIAGLEEIKLADHAREALQVRVAEVERKAVILRENFIASRTLRRQTETLVEEREKRTEREEERRRQQDLDDWHGSR